MGNQILPILVEKQEKVFFTSGRQGKRFRALSESCSRYNMKPSFFTDLKNVDPLIVWGVTTPWFGKVCEAYKNARIIIKGNPAIYSQYNVSIVGENTAAEAEEILSYFQKAQRTDIAVFAPHALHFESNCYVQTFLQKAQSCGIDISEDAIFWNENGLSETFKKFCEHRNRYNAVLCYNTQAAVFFCAAAKENGIRIPEELFVIGRGDLAIARTTTPSITTVSLREEDVGKHLVKLYRFLRSNADVRSTTILLNSYITPRGSTSFLPITKEEEKGKDLSFLSNQLPGEEIYLEIERIEKFLDSLNETDIRLLQGMRKGISREKLAEQEYIVSGTVQYRLRRMLQLTGTENRKSLFSLLDKYGIDVDLYKK